MFLIERKLTHKISFEVKYLRKFLIHDRSLQIRSTLAPSSVDFGFHKFTVSSANESVKTRTGRSDISAVQLCSVVFRTLSLLCGDIGLRNH